MGIIGREYQDQPTKDSASLWCAAGRNTAEATRLSFKQNGQITVQPLAIATKSGYLLGVKQDPSYTANARLRLEPDLRQDHIVGLQKLLEHIVNVLPRTFGVIYQFRIESSA